MPKVTVKIPSYNHGKFIGKAIQSILDQTFQDFEILIVDDCSPDNSVEVIKSFNDPRIKLIVNEKNMGACYGHNLMIDMAQGEYIALLNSDDIWLPNKLEKQVKFLDENHNYGAVFGLIKAIDETGKDLEDKSHLINSVFKQKNKSRYEWLNYFWHHGNCLCHPSILIRKEVYSTVGYYNPVLATLPDFEMWVRVCMRYDIFIIQEPLLKFRVLDGEKNESGVNPRTIISAQFEFKQILNHYLNLTDDEFAKIFNKPVEQSVVFSLAKMGVNNPTGRFMQLWGLDVLYEQLLLNKDIMPIRDFTNSVRSFDVFNLFPPHLPSERITVFSISRTSKYIPMMRKIKKLLKFVLSSNKM